MGYCDYFDYNVVRDSLEILRPTWPSGGTSGG